MGEKMACSSLFASFFRSQLKETLLPLVDYSPSPSSSSSSWLAVGGRSVKKMIPILEWAPRYNLATFQADLRAGITAAILSVPQGISYARLANLLPIINSSFVPPLIYAVLGTSANVAAGSTAAISLFLGSVVGNEMSPSESPELYMYVLFTVTFFSGVFEAVLGLFRLGIVVDLFSRSTITGFIGATAIVVILQQLKGVLGMKHFTTNTDLVSVVKASIVSHRDEKITSRLMGAHRYFKAQPGAWRWESAVLGTCLLSFLLFTKYMRGKFTRLFWLPAVGPLAVVVLGALFAYSVRAEDHGVLIVGPVNKGLNPVSISDFKFESRHLGLLLRAALISGFLALSDGIAVGRSLAIMKNEQIDSNQEMIAFGFMNIIGSCFSCYVTTGPFSKSAVNFHAGSRTAMSNAVMSACVMLVLLFLAPLFKYTPLVALSAIIIVAVTGLFEWEEARRLFKVDRFDFLMCMTAFLDVVFFSTTIGLLASIFTCSYDGLIRLMDVQNEIFNMIYSNDYLIYSICHSPDNVSSIFFGEGSGELKLWDERIGKISSTWDLHEKRINTIDFNPENINMMSTSSTDGTACIWDLRKLRKNQPESSKTVQHQRAVHSAYFSPGGICLATTRLRYVTAKWNPCQDAETESNRIGKEKARILGLSTPIDGENEYTNLEWIEAHTSSKLYGNRRRRKL